MASRVGVDKWLFFTTGLLVVAGLVMVFSASAVMAQERYHSPYAFVGKQAIWALLGVGAMIGLMRVDARIYNSRKVVIPAVSVVTLLLVAVYCFPGSHHTHRWIRFGDFFTFQPSEIAKLVLILYLSWFLHTRLDRINNLRETLLPALAVPVVFILLVVKQPDLGTALVLAGVTAAMLALAGMRFKFLAICAGVALPPLLALLLWVPWRRARVMAFLHPGADLQGAGFHINQSLIAVGSGGFTGRGYMEGVQKLFFLPEAHTDFIFANIAEELGFLGAVGIVFLFALFGFRGLRTVFRAGDTFLRFAAFGITTAILLQAFFNISVVLAMVPTKGIPLPLISSGGTSVFFTLAGIGILLNITEKAESEPRSGLRR